LVFLVYPFLLLAPPTIPYELMITVAVATIVAFALVIACRAYYLGRSRKNLDNPLQLEELGSPVKLREQPLHLEDFISDSAEEERIVC